MRYWNKRLSGKGLRVIPLRFKNNRALIYIYRPVRLLYDLKNDTARKLLDERGYCTEEPQKCIVQLVKRLAECEEFPHEIGLFLGYPPEDVCGFIENKDGCKCIGCWKVYGDVEASKKMFAKYKKCTDVYCSQYAKGRPIERLALAV